MNAKKEEMAVVDRTLSVPWICGPGWEGSDEDLQLAWAAEMSRGWEQRHNSDPDPVGSR